MSQSIDDSCFIHKSAVVTGDVSMGSGCSVWPQAAIRGDRNRITIGKNSNVQDNAVIHVSINFPTIIGDNVTLGHSCVVHGATLEDAVIIGINATVLNGAVVGEGSIVAAGAVVLEGAVIPPASLVVGVPGRVARSGDPALREKALKNAETYRILGEKEKQKEEGPE